MAKPIRKREQKHKSLVVEPLPLARENYLILGAGILVIIAGYVAMLAGGVETPVATMLATMMTVQGRPDVTG